MGDKDKLTKMYMRNPEKFADFFNGFIYSGKDVIDWRSLEEVGKPSNMSTRYQNTQHFCWA